MPPQLMPPIKLPAVLLSLRGRSLVMIGRAPEPWYDEPSATLEMESSLVLALRRSSLRLMTLVADKGLPVAPASCRAEVKLEDRFRGEFEPNRGGVPMSIGGVVALMVTEDGKSGKSSSSSVSSNSGSAGSGEKVQSEPRSGLWGCEFGLWRGPLSWFDAPREEVSVLPGLARRRPRRFGGTDDFGSRDGEYCPRWRWDLGPCQLTDGE